MKNYVFYAKAQQGKKLCKYKTEIAVEASDIGKKNWFSITE